MSSEIRMTTPEAELKADITATRAQLGQTLEALAAKTHVKTRAKDAARDGITDLKRRGLEVASRARAEAVSAGRRIRGFAGTRKGQLSAAAVLAGTVTALVVTIRTRSRGGCR
jgi:hypothetical protein